MTRPCTKDMCVLQLQCLKGTRYLNCPSVRWSCNVVLVPWGNSWFDGGMLIFDIVDVDCRCPMIRRLKRIATTKITKGKEGRPKPWCISKLLAAGCGLWPERSEKNPEATADSLQQKYPSAWRLTRALGSLVPSMSGMESFVTCQLHQMRRWGFTVRCDFKRNQGPAQHVIRE